MPATDPTPAEITALERRIAEGVMEWTCVAADLRVRPGGAGLMRVPPYYRDEKGQRREAEGPSRWSPWNDAATALKVLERLAKGGPYWIQRVDSKTFEVGFGFPSDHRGWAESPGPHFGPAVCKLAENILFTQSAETKGA